MNFSFCGVDISTCGLYYIPKPKDIFVWDNQYDNHDLQVPGFDGGYWFGQTVKPKVFELECYFEEITHLQMKKIQSLFQRGKTGQLIFDERPFLSYTATVTAMTRPEVHSANSGFVSIQLTAYYPFAVMDRLSVGSMEEYGNQYEELLSQATGILHQSKTPASVIDTEDGITQEKNILLYNPGDERADVIIRIAGDVGGGVSIFNSATGHRCTVKGLTLPTTSNVGKWLEIDSRSGKVYMTNGTTAAMAFLYHDDGFIQLEGSNPITRNIHVSYEGDLVMSAGLFTADMLGKYIYINSEWKKIADYYNPNTIKIDYVFSSPGTQTQDVVKMNYITITPQTSMNIKKLEFVYSPTFK